MAGVQKFQTIGESLYWCYANLAMAHSAITHQSAKYSQVHFIVRSKLFAGLKNRTMNLGSIADDERLKMILPQACNYCGKTERLSIDHLIPTAKGGKDTADNMVWACRQCNSAKNDTDLLDWYNTRGIFPPLLLLRRYLKMAVNYCIEHNVMDAQIAEAGALPFSLYAIPHNFPQPSELVLWIIPLE